MSGSDSQQNSSMAGQYRMKREVRDVLIGHVYQSDRLLDKIFNTSLPQDLERVIEDCINEFKNFPLQDSKDERHHDSSVASFVARLNIVKKSLENHKLMETNIYNDVIFEKYDERSKECTGKDVSLQPGIIARAPPSTKDEVSWMDVELCVEVNQGHYADMIVRGAYFARSIFEAQRSRYFVLIIFYEETAAEFFFGLFTPAWLCLSPRTNIRNTDGQRQFIRDMSRIWSCESRWSAGFDVTCNNTWCYLGKTAGTYLIDRDVFHRVTVIGRQTRVDIITSGKADNAHMSEMTPTAASVGGTIHEFTPGTEIPITTPKSQSTATLTVPLETSQHRASPSMLPVFHSPPRYDKLVLKDSWPILSREKHEEKVFEGVGSKFGVPMVLSSFPVTIQQNNAASAIKSDTAWFFPENATKLELYNIDFNHASGSSQSVSQRTNEDPEHRVHVRLLIQTEGKPLYKAKGPKELVQAVLHAMIGYWVIFEKGWLHRDVSEGNVLLMVTPEKRDKIEGFEDIFTENILRKYFDKCIGFISDGDRAIQCKDINKEMQRGTGTPPFMSRRLITAELAKERVPHSAIDDLESFVWVLFSAVLRTMEILGVQFSPKEQIYRSCLQSLDLDKLYRRSGFVYTLEETALDLERRPKVVHRQSEESSTSMLPDQRSEQSDALTNQPPGVLPNVSFAFEPFVSLLLEWLTLSRELWLAYWESPISANCPESLRPYFKKYLEIGITHLEKLPDTWELPRNHSTTF